MSDVQVIQVMSLWLFDEIQNDLNGKNIKIYGNNTKKALHFLNMIFTIFQCVDIE